MARIKQPLKSKIRVAIRVLNDRGGRWEKGLAGRLGKILRASDKNVRDVIRANITTHDYNWIQARARGLRVAAKALRKERHVAWARAAGRALKKDVAALRDIQRTIEHLKRAASKL